MMKKGSASSSPTCKWAVPKDHFRRCTRTLPRVLARADACTEVAGWRRPHLVHRLLDQRRPVPSSNASAMHAVSEVELQSRRVHVRGGTGMLALACGGVVPWAKKLARNRHFARSCIGAASCQFRPPHGRAPPTSAEFRLSRAFS